ncbi:MAG: hypothetical protein EBR51_04685, partial [Gammaproteobacteria bacterium]|nr:hypothetical protein [Gammaproteobacteria bacterium]
ECPLGLNPGYDELWWRGLSKPDRAKFTDNGLKSRLERYFVAIRRGPNGEDVCMNPTSVKDPPLMLVEGEKSYGMDLDGKDGVATGKSCPHQEFTGLDGTPGVDNQLYRLLGCVYGFRSYGQFEANENENRKSNGKGMTLIEVTGVDDVRNDPDVRVTIYRAVDQYTLDGSGRFLPYGSYRIDVADGKPRYSSTLRGKIVDGVLTTEPGDVNLPFYGNYTYMNRFLRDLRFRIKLADDAASAEGMAAGYLGVDQLMFYVGGLGPIQSSAPANCPSIHVAAYEVADGHPDPKTGRCTTLSSAYNFKAVAAFIVHGESQRYADGWFDRVRRFISDLRASN